MEAFLREDAGMFENSHINNTMTILIGSKRKYLLKTVHKHMIFFSKIFFGGQMELPKEQLLAGAQEMTQQEKGLLCKYMDAIQIPRTHIKLDAVLDTPTFLC